MGTLRSGFLAGLILVSSAFAQDANPNNPAPGTPAPAPVTDPNAPAPILTPEQPDPNALIPVDPNAIAAPITTPPAPAPKPKPKAPVIPTFRGTVASLDKGAMTITIHSKAKDETFAITSKTRIFADNKPAILADARDGENAAVEYRNLKGKRKEALTLRLGKGAAAPVRKAKPAVKKTEPAHVPETAAPTPTLETPLVPAPENPTTPVPTPATNP